MKWYKYNINDMTEQLYQGYLAMMCECRRARVENKSLHEDRARSVAAEMLLRMALSETFGVSEEDITILEDERGAPYADKIDVHVSISHSGDYAVCAIADCPVGIDIEKIRPINMRVAERTFSVGELEYLGADGKMTDEVLLRFYEIWTAKEAYGKMLGTGILLKDTVDTAKLENIQREYPNGYVISIITQKTLKEEAT